MLQSSLGLYAVIIPICDRHLSIYIEFDIHLIGYASKIYCKNLDNG